MGYVHKRDTLYRLTFEDKYPGLEVTMTGLTIGETLDSMQLDMDTDTINTIGEGTQVTPATMRAIQRLHERSRQQIEMFAGHIRSWNLEHETSDGVVPVPATLAGVSTQDGVLIRDILTAWREAITTIPSPLGNASSNGESSLGLSILMEPSAPNPMSSQQPNSS